MSYMKNLKREQDKLLGQIYKCAECKESLTDAEIEDAINNDLDLGEVCCDRCWEAWKKERIEELRHPDNRR